MVVLATSFARARAGSRSAARMLMVRITTISSRSVNPAPFVVRWTVSVTLPVFLVFIRMIAISFYGFQSVEYSPFVLSRISADLRKKKCQESEDRDAVKHPSSNHQDPEKIQIPSSSSLCERKRWNFIELPGTVM